MALTVTNHATGPGLGGSRSLRVQSDRDLVCWIGTVAFDDSYPTGGEAFNAETQSGFTDVVQVWVAPKAGYVFEYVDSATAANRKIKAYFSDYDAGADGALIEVADTTDLEAVTGVQVIVFGYR